MRTVPIVLALLSVTFEMAAATGPTAKWEGSGPMNVPGNDRGWGWVDPPNLNGAIISSERIDQFGLESMVANDFLATAGNTITKVHWWGGYYNCTSYPDCTPRVNSFLLDFYVDEGGRPGSIIAEYILPDLAHEQQVNVQPSGVPVCSYYADISFTFPASQVYWFGVQAGDHAYPPQWGRLAADMVRGEHSAFKSAFFGYPDWVPVSEILGAPYDASQAFEEFPTDDLVFRNFTPPSWQGEYVDWIRDVNPRNKVDDLIDESADSYFDIIVNFGICPTPADIDRLNQATGGAVSYVSSYITTAAAMHVPRAAVYSVASWDEVAFIERECGFSASLDVSVPAIKVTSSAQYPTENLGYCKPSLNGQGVNVVIMDSGVDNTLHQAFAATPFIGGYDALTNTFGDPDDDLGHGTHVASIALGQATANTSRGVAPAAGLIDVKVFGAGVYCNTPGQWQKVMKGLETVYDNRQAWNVKVINMSFRQCNAGGSVPSDGQDAFSQLVDLAQSMGIVTVAAAGNDGPSNGFLTTPAAATRSIAVAAADDHNTVLRTDDTIAGFSSKGPRSNDLDLDCVDELKPEVTAPGVNIRAANYNTTNGMASLSGTSMAAPHVAGLAALVFQDKPTINAASVKDVIIRGCQQIVTPSGSTCDPNWDFRWGWGLVDAWRSICSLPSTNLTFRGECTWSPGWLSPDIETDPFPPKVNFQNKVYAWIKNAGPTAVPAGAAQIKFGEHDYSGSIYNFFDIGTLTPALPIGVTKVGPIYWKPATTGHHCLSVEIAYAPDTDYSCNKAQRNIEVAQSPVFFQARNTLTLEPRQVRFDWWLDPPNAAWDVTITPPYVTMGADDCPQTIRVDLEPDGAALGDTGMVHVATRIETPGGMVEVGGVTVIKVNRAASDVSDPANLAGLDLVLQGTNPFADRVGLSYSLPEAGHARLAIYDVSGGLIATLSDRREDAGSHLAVWEGRDANGARAPSGVYFARLHFKGKTISRAMVLTK